MAYIDAFRADTSLIGRLGEGNAHLVWAMGLYLEEADLGALASEALTDGPNDKKIDFILLNRDAKRIFFAQGFYGAVGRDTAPANKASDLNTAAAWLISGDLNEVPDPLRPIIEDCRTALEDGDVEAIDLLYVHNHPESVNVARELLTAAAHLKNALGAQSEIAVTARELGSSRIDHLFSSQESHIEVREEVVCPSIPAFTEVGPKWNASIMSVPGSWLHELFIKYGERLFSANYRGFLGTAGRRRINTQIRSSAEARSKDFWVFNNGITILTLASTRTRQGTQLTGISRINGAQTTGSIGSVDRSKFNLGDVKVLCRVIQCSDADTISEIVRYNNTQNEITAWDQYSNNPDQNRIAHEFDELGHGYARKRGFRQSGELIGIEDVIQPLLAFHGRYRDANRGKNIIFDRKRLYSNAFDGKKSRHILFVYTLARSIDEKRIELKNKSSDNTIIDLEEDQLTLLRNLRFKSFLIAMVANVLGTALGRRIDIDTVAFTPTAAKASENSVLSLVAAWSPLVDSILVFMVSQIEAGDFSRGFSEDGYLESAGRKISALLYANRNNIPFSGFSALVSDS